MGFLKLPEDELMNELLSMRISESLRVLSLLSIAYKPLRPIEIAEMLDLPTKNVTTYLARLAKKGLVEKVSSSDGSSRYQSKIDMLELIIRHEKDISEIKKTMGLE